MAKKLKPGRWESAAAAAEHLDTTPDDVRRRIVRHEIAGFRVRPRGRWYVTSEGIAELGQEDGRRGQIRTGDP